ncbi:hypothetical protein RB653_005976 [Dictyostelium firmibasis]|uniref:Uncharacterized protein n=1 Tax=Dictyostelium firmibasis TaxID=79012 RepID=A0AAN7UB87_9MYCE
MTIIINIIKMNKHELINNEIISEIKNSDFNSNSLFLNKNDISMAISMKQGYCNMFRPFLYSIFPLSYKEK